MKFLPIVSASVAALLLVQSALLPCVSAEGHTTTISQENAVFLWSSTGGGWRAQMACVGFANLFQKAGLLGEDSSLLHSVVSLKKNWDDFGACALFVGH